MAAVSDKMSFSRRILLLMQFFFFFLIGASNKAAGQVKPSFHYTVSHPDALFQMEDDLTEISGISYVSNGLLACEQDEKGSLYLYDLHRRSVVRKIKFGSHGDYEDVALVGNTAYLLRSDGTLFVFPMNKGDNPESRKIHTSLSSENNTEGLCYYKDAGELLIACKFKDGIAGEKLNGKAIYAFDIRKETLDEKPKILIPYQTVQNFIAGETHQNLNLKDAFMPSGISISPIDHRLYLLASKGERQKLLCILSLQGGLEQVIELPANLFAQPEGICFAPDGTLFISNEGRGGKGTILQFAYRK